MGVALSTVPQASRMEGCPLLEIPPELRLIIYDCTLDLDLDDFDYDQRSGRIQTQTWETTPLVKLATTCRLIANEARDFVRNLRATRRVATVQVSWMLYQYAELKTHFRRLPCPLADLRHVDVTLDYQKLRFEAPNAFAFAFPDGDEGSKSAYCRIEYELKETLRGLRRMQNVDLFRVAHLQCFRLCIDGLQRIGAESHTEAVQRITGTKPERLKSTDIILQAIVRYENSARDERDYTSPALMSVEGKLLYLWG